MTSLAALQEALQAYVLRGSDEIATHVVGTARVPAATRLAIYGNAYRLRLTEALAGNYPALVKLIGDEGFADLAADYIRAHDSHRASIRWYGDALAAFLESDPRYAEAPLLAELARWEWALSEAFDAADAQPLAPEALATVEPERWADLRFTWHPSVRTVALAWNAPQIRAAIKDGRERPPAGLCDEPQPWLVWRHGLDVRYRSVDALESRGIEMSRGGASFGELCELIAAHDASQAAVRAAGWLREWLGAGLIVAAA
jgi:hypothetical protein